MIDTKQKILDAAEWLFAEHGYAGVSLRQIIAEADVNLAAIHYHFGSKEEVLDNVVMRKAGPVNQRRLEWLERLEREGGINDVNAILTAFLMPMAATAETNPDFAKMMGRLQAEGLLTTVVFRNFEPVLMRFFRALRLAVPNLPDAEFSWRVHFMQGSIAYTMAVPGGLPGQPQVEASFETRIARLITFLNAGLRAPVTNGMEEPRTGK